MTLSEILIELDDIPAETPLVFATKEGETGVGYHLTELKRAEISSIDCGGRPDSWTELTLQIPDGEDGKPLSVGTFRGIAAKSAKAIGAVESLPLTVEFGHQNKGLRLYRPGTPIFDGTRAVLPLADNRAQCKPAQSMSCCAPA